MRINKGKVWISLGLLLIAAALSLSIYNLFDGFRAEQAANQIIQELDTILPTEIEEPAIAPTGEQEPIPVEEPIIPDYILNPKMEMPVETINGIDYIGVLQIPAIELELPIISQWSYPNLKTAPCRYSGSAYRNNLILCAHNYTSHFGHLKLLQEGDTVTFTDIDGNVFVYTVVLTETLGPTDVEEMESGGWDLTLFTCTIGGRTRVTVRCEQVAYGTGKGEETG